HVTRQRTFQRRSSVSWRERDIGICPRARRDATCAAARRWRLRAPPPPWQWARLDWPLRSRAARLIVSRARAREPRRATVSHAHACALDRRRPRSISKLLETPHATRRG